MDLLQQIQMKNVGKDQNSSNINAGSMNFVDSAVFSFIDFTNPSCKCFESSADLWIIDSGASNHMTINRTSLTNITTLPCPMLVYLSNGYKVKVMY